MKITTYFLWFASCCLGVGAFAEDPVLDYGPDVSAEVLLDQFLAEVELKPRVRWGLDASVSGGAGYKQNVLFSPLVEQDSAFSLAELDLFVFREGSPDNQIFFYGFADQRHYFELDRADDEQTAIAEASWTRRLDGQSAFNLRARYTYLDQFFDASISDVDIVAVRLQQHEVGGQTYFERELGRHITGRIGAGAKDVQLRDFDDDYRAWEGLAQLVYRPTPRFETGLVYRREIEDYDDRLQRSAVGERNATETVEITTDRLDLFAWWWWDDARRWRTRLNVSGRLREDDGGGYYDYQSWRTRFSLSGPVWGFRWEGGLYYGNTDYDVRPSRFGDETAPLLYRTNWQVRLRVEHPLSRHWLTFLGGAWEDYDSNDPLDVYDQQWAAGGVRCQF